MPQLRLRSLALPTATHGRQHISLRIAGDDLALIDKLAADHRLSRTDYMVRASTGELEDPIDLDERFDSIERRLERVERLAGLGVFE
jgi:uncharacterized protein (DUF1778 family)